MKPKHLYGIMLAAMVLIGGYFTPRYLDMRQMQQAMKVAVEKLEAGDVAAGISNLKLALAVMKDTQGVERQKLLENATGLLVAVAAARPEESRLVLDFLKENAVTVPCEDKIRVYGNHLGAAGAAMDAGKREVAGLLLALGDEWRTGCAVGPEISAEHASLGKRLAAMGGKVSTQWTNAPVPAAAPVATGAQTAAVPAPAAETAPAQGAAPAAPAAQPAAAPAAPVSSVKGALEKARGVIPSKGTFENLLQKPKAWLDKVKALVSRVKPGASAATGTADVPTQPAAPAPAASSVEIKIKPAAPAPAQPAPEPQAAKAPPAPAAPEKKETKPVPAAPEKQPALARTLKARLATKGISADDVRLNPVNNVVHITFRSRSMGTPKLVDELKILFAVVDDAVNEAKWPAKEMRVSVGDVGGLTYVSWGVGMEDYREYRHSKINGSEFRRRWR